MSRSEAKVRVSHCGVPASPVLALWHFLGLNGSQDLPHPLDLHPIPDAQPGASPVLLSLWPGSQSTFPSAQTDGSPGHSSATSHGPSLPRWWGGTRRARLAAASDVSHGGGEEEACAQSCPGCTPPCLGAAWGPRAWGWEVGQGLNMLPVRRQPPRVPHPSLGRGGQAECGAPHPWLEDGPWLQRRRLGLLPGR